MNAVVIEHVKLSDLPETWREKLPTIHAERVTVRIEEEPVSRLPSEGTGSTVDLLFGMWCDHKDMNNVTEYLCKLRASRYNPDGSRNTG